MANLPVDSMREGGLFWFTDLTMADPYFLLPILTSVTMWITLEVLFNFFDITVKVYIFNI